MPRVENELVCDDGSPLKAFAAGLRRRRAATGRTYRELAAGAHYSHTNLVRAASGRTLPTWELASAYLVACGASERELSGWYDVWTAIDALPRTRRHYAPAEVAVVLARINALSGGVHA
ncbi:helix-turn-helix domain-containing protein [Kribbella sp. DT2]|uniref:helix-turn-helix domain-containing protein n=1 Tax=Kribbella sp. DT2 TaxID=3393427 RepID=UPI003CEA5F4B